MSVKEQWRDNMAKERAFVAFTLQAPVDKRAHRGAKLRQRHIFHVEMGNKIEGCLMKKMEIRWHLFSKFIHSDASFSYPDIKTISLSPSYHPYIIYFLPSRNKKKRLNVMVVHALSSNGRKLDTFITPSFGVNTLQFCLPLSPLYIMLSPRFKNN